FGVFAGEADAGQHDGEVVLLDGGGVVVAVYLEGDGVGVAALDEGAELAVGVGDGAAEALFGGVAEVLLDEEALPLVGGPLLRREGGAAQLLRLRPRGQSFPEVLRDGGVAAGVLAVEQEAGAVPTDAHGVEELDLAREEDRRGPLQADPGAGVGAGDTERP